MCKLITAIIILLFSTSLFAEEELFLECTKMEMKFECENDTCIISGYEKTDEIKFLRFFDVPLYTSFFTPKDRNKKEVKDFYKNTRVKAIEFYEDRTFTEILGGNLYRSISMMREAENFDVLWGNMENPLQKYYVLFAPDFLGYVHQEIVIMNRYTLETKFITDYRSYKSNDTIDDIRNLTDKIIDTKRYKKSTLKLLSHADSEIDKIFKNSKPGLKYQPQPTDFKCEIIEKLNKLL